MSATIYNFLTVINEMCKPPALDISMFTGNTNLIAIGKTNIKGWSHIDISITDEVAEKILNSDMAVQLIVFSIEDFEKTMKKLGMEKPV